MGFQRLLPRAWCSFASTRMTPPLLVPKANLGTAPTRPLGAEVSEQFPEQCWTEQLCWGRCASQHRTQELNNPPCCGRPTWLSLEAPHMPEFRVQPSISNLDESVRSERGQGSCASDPGADEQALSRKSLG